MVAVAGGGGGWWWRWLSGYWSVYRRVAAVYIAGWPLCISFLTATGGVEPVSRGDQLPNKVLVPEKRS